MATYDFTDPQIVEMVEYNHHPIEVALGQPKCRQCYQEWPCPVITELRAHKAYGRGF